MSFLGLWLFKQVDIVVPELLVEELLEMPLEIEVLVGKTRSWC